MIDDGHAIHYTEVAPGTPVYGSDEVEVGTVEAVLDNYRERIFDGLVIRAADGRRRFVDAPEVKRTAERAVTLSITSVQAGELPPPDDPTPTFRPRRGRLARRVLGGWKKE